jgi:hypothetical protein
MTDKALDNTLGNQAITALSLLSKRGKITIGPPQGQRIIVNYNGLSLKGRHRMDLTAVDEDLILAVLKIFNQFKDRPNG